MTHDYFEVVAESDGPMLRLTAEGNVLMPNLPTSDPAVAGALYNDAGTLKISAG
jgi:hypothetical protein